MREDVGGRLVVLLRSEVFCADPHELRGHELEYVVVEGPAWSPMEPVIAVGLFPWASTFRRDILGLLWVLDPTMCARAVRGTPKTC